MRTAVRRALSAAAEWWPFIVVPVVLVAAACVGGCVPTEKRSTIEQTQRESVAGKANAEVLRETQVQPPPVTVTTKDGTRVEMPAAVTETVRAKTEASEVSDSAATGRAEDSETIPLFVKLIGGAVGLSMLLGVGWLLLRSSRALRAAYAVADDYLARGINRVRTMAQVETDPARANLLNSIVSGLEAERAEYNKD